MNKKQFWEIISPPSTNEYNQQQHNEGIAQRLQLLSDSDLVDYQNIYNEYTEILDKQLINDIHKVAPVEQQSDISSFYAGIIARGEDYIKEVVSYPDRLAEDLTSALKESYNPDLLYLPLTEYAQRHSEALSGFTKAYQRNPLEEKVIAEIHDGIQYDPFIDTPLKQAMEHGSFIALEELYDSSNQNQVVNNALEKSAEQSPIDIQIPEFNFVIPEIDDSEALELQEEKTAVTNLSDFKKALFEKAKLSDGIELSKTLFQKSRSTVLNLARMLDEEKEDLTQTLTMRNSASTLGFESVNKIKVRSVECKELGIQKTFFPSKKLTAKLLDQITCISGMVTELGEQGKTQEFKELIQEHKIKDISDVLSKYKIFREEHLSQTLAHSVEVELEEELLEESEIEPPELQPEMLMT